jgi:hypothetical protein
MFLLWLNNLNMGASPYGGTGALFSIDPRAGQILSTLDPSQADPRAGQILDTDVPAYADPRAGTIIS